MLLRRIQLPLQPPLLRTPAPLSPYTPMSDIRKLPNSVEMSVTSSNVACNGKLAGATIAGEPVRKKIANLNPILKHLGLANVQVRRSSAASNSKDCSLSNGKNKIANVDLIQKTAISPLKQPEPTPARVIDHKKDTPLPIREKSVIVDPVLKTEIRPFKQPGDTPNGVVDHKNETPFPIPANKDCSLFEDKNKCVNVDSTQKAAVSCLKQPEPTPARVSCHKKEAHLPSTSSSFTSTTKRHHQSRSPTRNHQWSEGSYQQDDEFFDDIKDTRMLEEHSLPTGLGKRKVSRPSKSEATPYHLQRGAGTGVNRESKNNRSCFTVEPFDICPSQRTENVAFLGSPVDHMEDGVEVNDMDQLRERPRQLLLRPGMVLLKGYLTHTEQVSILEKCRDLGLAPGGFYQPCFKTGAKLRLHMMCLGLDWDPQTRKYLKRRKVDRVEPPPIPHGFDLLVNRAMQDSHALIRRDSKHCEAEQILPPMSPDICIVNFYNETGRLGLHQDRDESVESLKKGLPVVSFSVGDSAEFLYGDQRDPNKAEKVVLESGDVLIFGGESRHVFHGVASIIPDSAPLSLVEETGLRPGRLNLTFRKY